MIHELKAAVGFGERFLVLHTALAIVDALAGAVTAVCDHEGI